MSFMDDPESETIKEMDFNIRATVAFSRSNKSLIFNLIDVFPKIDEMKILSQNAKTKIAFQHKF